MKRLWYCVGILVLLLSGTLINAWAIQRTTNTLSDMLLQAESLAEAGDWSQAEHITQKALNHWDDASDYLYIVLRHNETDTVDTGFHEVLEFIYCQEAGEYSAANASLVAEIKLLSDMEQLSLKNLL